MLLSLGLLGCAPAEPPPAITPASLRVVVATRTLYLGLPIEESQLRIESIPWSSVKGVEDKLFASTHELVGRTPHDMIYQGDIVRAERLATPGKGPGIDALLYFGQRAVPLEMTPAEVALGLAPGAVVDIHWSRRERACGIVTPWVTGVEVLAVSEGADARRWMTLRVQDDRALALVSVPRDELRVVQRARWDIVVQHGSLSLDCDLPAEE
ncbi:MAG: Flp pilus assembly protein CpaB [Myxococcota bacterium]